MQEAQLTSKLPGDKLLGNLNKIITNLSNEIKNKFIDNPTNKLILTQGDTEICMKGGLNLHKFDVFLQNCLYIVFLISLEYTKKEESQKENKPKENESEEDKPKEDILEEHIVVFDGVKKYFINRYIISPAYKQSNQEYDVNNIAMKIQEVTSSVDNNASVNQSLEKSYTVSKDLEQAKKKAEAMKKVLSDTISKLEKTENELYSILETLRSSIKISEILSYLEVFINNGIFVYPEISIFYNSTINFFGLQNKNAEFETCLGLFFPVYSDEYKVDYSSSTENKYRFILLREVAKSVSADYGIYGFVKKYLNSMLDSQKGDQSKVTYKTYVLEFLAFFIGDLIINFLYNEIPKLEIVRFLPIAIEKNIIDKKYNLVAEYFYVLFQKAWHKAEVIKRGDSIFLFDCAKTQIRHSNKIIIETYDDKNYVCYQ